MLTVAILINGEPIVAKNAVFQGIYENGLGKYINDAGEVIWHRREEGAVALAKALLDTIRNDGFKKQESQMQAAERLRGEERERKKSEAAKKILRLSPDGPEEVPEGSPDEEGG